MIPPSETKSEKERLEELESYSIMDSIEESDFDNLTKLASQICQTKISLVSLVDDKRQWFKSKYGLKAKETTKEVAFCAHAINDPDKTLIVPDARKDKRFHDNPLVKNDPYVTFYAGVPLNSEKGLPLGTLCVIDDKPNELSESQLESLNALSAQVMNLIELRKKKKELEEVNKVLIHKNKEIEQFAFIAAHDLKSPLNNIQGLIDILIREGNGEISAGNEKVLDAIQVSSKKLRELVDALLEYSRAEKINIEEKTSIEPKTLIQNLESVLANDNSSQISLNTELNKIDVNVPAINQILLNLVSNAVKYNDKEKSLIDIGVLENNGHYKFSVKDNGPGIPSNEQKRIFSMFETVGYRDKFGQKGTGIGLAIVKKTVKALGGSIYVNSTIGQGSKFIFTVEK